MIRKNDLCELCKKSCNNKILCPYEPKYNKCPVCGKLVSVAEMRCYKCGAKTIEPQESEG